MPASIDTGNQPLLVPDSLQPTSDRQLPHISQKTLDMLSYYGWRRIGLMVAFIDTAGRVLMLEHHGRDKNAQDMLGPFGETSKRSGPVIEQPKQTMWRGIGEELGKDDPSDLELKMHKAGGWVINQWPRGIRYPGQFSCAISFPLFISDASQEELLSISHNGEEVGGASFMAPDEIFALEDASLRPGVKPWLQQLGRAGLLLPNDEFGGIVDVNFTEIFEASLTDIDL